MFRPKKPHFFQPLLPGCLSQINIPSAFFSKYLSSRKKIEKAVLRTSFGEWTVKIEGQKIENGWANFVRDNNLNIGDFVVFKLNGNMVFDVVVFGPSACEKKFSQLKANKILQQGTSSSPNKSEKKKSTCTKYVEKSGITKSGNPYFVSTIKQNCLNRSRFYIPVVFARENGLIREGEIVLSDVNKRSWTLGLRKDGEHACIASGWSAFRNENGLEFGDSFIFELIRQGKKPIANFIITK